MFNWSTFFESVQIWLGSKVNFLEMLLEHDLYVPDAWFNQRVSRHHLITELFNITFNST